MGCWVAGWFFPFLLFPNLSIIYLVIKIFLYKLFYTLYSTNLTHKIPFINHFISTISSKNRVVPEEVQRLVQGAYECIPLYGEVDFTDVTEGEIGSYLE